MLLTKEQLTLLRRVFRARWTPQHFQHVFGNKSIEIDEVDASRQCISIVFDELGFDRAALEALYKELYVDEISLSTLTQEQIHMYLLTRMDQIINSKENTDVQVP